MDIEQLRRETPACGNLIHFNNAGAALSPQPVTASVIEHLQLEQQIGGYEAAARASGQLEQFYHAMAGLLNCNPREIAYAENASRGWNQLLHAIPFGPGDRILTGQSEYASNYLSLLHFARQKQIAIEVIENGEDGRIDLEQLQQHLDSDVRLIALTHVASQSGVVQPAQEVGRLARQHRIFYLLDASQSAGQCPLNVNELHCDMLVGTGRKYLRGPRGTGFLYVRNAIVEYLEPATVELHTVDWRSTHSYRIRDDARRFESWESNVAGKIGLGVAADYAVRTGIPASAERIRQLAAHLRSALRCIPGIRVHEPDTDELCGLVTFSSEHESAQAVHERLQQRGINSSVTRRAATLLDFDKRGLNDINRASLHYYNTEEEIADFCDQLER